MMPVFRGGLYQAPQGCEVDFFFIFELTGCGFKRFCTSAVKEKLFIGNGNGMLQMGGQEYPYQQGDIFNLENTGEKIIVDTSVDSVLIRVGGHWSDPSGDCGVFELDNSEKSENIGDPVDYPRTTNFDNHYHDCDEYWIIFKGDALAVSENKFYHLRKGDCLFTAQGSHHDLPQIFEKIHGVYLETSLKGLKRKGHLWSRTHGPAES